MISIRNITSTILVVMLVLMTGLGNDAHAMSGDCMDVHCDSDLMMSHISQHDMLETQVAAHEGTPHGSNASDHEACNPMLCHALAFLPTWNTHHFVPSEMALVWHVILPNALARADAPDRPPNL